MADCAVAEHAQSPLTIDANGELHCEYWEKFSGYQRRVVKEIFDVVDTTKDGEISPFEFCTLMSAYQGQIDNRCNKLLFALFPPDGRTIRFQTFCAWVAVMFMDPVEPCEDLEAELSRLLKAADSASVNNRENILVMKRKHVVDEQLVATEVHF